MWKLRQFFEGDTQISLENVQVGCWAPVDGPIVANSIAIEVDGVEHLITTGTLGAGGVLTLRMPTNVIIGATTVIKAYSKCVDEATSGEVTSKIVSFGITNSVIKSCNPQVILESFFSHRIRFFFSLGAATYFNANWAGTPLEISNFDYQVGETGNITGVAGVFGRPTVGTTFNTLISKAVYSNNPLTVVPKTLNYFTARFGYMEVIFDNGTLQYINYMQSGDSGILGTYVIDDTIEINSTTTGYTVKKNGIILKTVTKNITYTVTGGTVVPATSTVGTPVVWNLPVGVGAYTFTATVGDALKFQKTIQLHSCAQAVNDNFTGTLNTAYGGTVATNDVLCTGENTYFEKVGTAGQVIENVGTLIFNQNGSFSYTPPLDYGSTATFDYNIRCGTTFETSEITGTARVVIDYFNICQGVVANWQATGQTRCNNCIEQREERDVNAQCTGNVNRWVNNPGGSSCTDQPNLIPTGVTRCEDCVNQRQVQDLNPCSPTYQDLSWETAPSGTVCNNTPNWVDQAAFECQSCVEKKRQIDNNPCSPSYNTTRWVDNVGGTACNKTPVWTDLDEFLCINCTEYKKQQDTNPCSASYQLVKNTLHPSGNVCTTDLDWSDTGVTRCENSEHQKQQITTNQCSASTIRWVPTGLDICDCEVSFSINNICTDGNRAIGAVVTRTDVVENNRLISLLNNIITFKTDVGTFSYKAVVSFETGSPVTVWYKSKSCQPII